jgi:hypothetical protein
MRKEVTSRISQIVTELAVFSIGGTRADGGRPFSWIFRVSICFRLPHPLKSDPSGPIVLPVLSVQGSLMQQSQPLSPSMSQAGR